MKIEQWFLEKNYTSSEIYAMSCADEPEVVKETEKALFLVFKSQFGKIKGWFPKSVVYEEMSEQSKVKLEQFEIGTKVIVNNENGIVVKNQNVGNENLITVKFGKKEKTFLQSICKIKVA